MLSKIFLLFAGIFCYCDGRAMNGLNELDNAIKNELSPESTVKNQRDIDNFISSDIVHGLTQQDHLIRLWNEVTFFEVYIRLRQRQLQNNFVQALTKKMAQDRTDLTADEIKISQRVFDLRVFQLRDVIRRPTKKFRLDSEDNEQKAN